MTGWVAAAALVAIAPTVICAVRGAGSPGIALALAPVPAAAWLYALTATRTTGRELTDTSAVTYAAWDRHGHLLYIGMTTQQPPSRRWAQHETTAAWAPLVHHWTILSHHPTERAARTAELELIRRHQPPHNIAGR